jgi:glucose-6-phosphate isomerase
MMKINNFWENETINPDLISHMRSQFNSLPHFKILENDDAVIADMEKISAFKKFKDIIIFGIGGSSLGGQMLYQFTQNENMRLHFVDNIDSKTFNKKLTSLDLPHTGIICISKSGNTAETLMQLLLTKQLFEQKIGQFWSNHFAILTEDRESALRLFAKKFNVICFNHDLNIGGRFCIFTNVGAIIAALCDNDFISFRKGARDILKQPLEWLLQGAQYMTYLNQHKNVNQSIMMVYADCLEMYAQWYGQLWGESLGKMKNGLHMGITPIASVGAVDQHSQLQLYLDGPRDKLISLVSVSHHEDTAAVKDIGIEHPAFETLLNKKMNHLLFAEQMGTLDTFKNRGCHVRQFDLPDSTPYYLGQLVMYQMVETIATAFLLGVDPFDQPAVEESKVRAMTYLKQQG